jgi:hypothetical protein
MKITVEVKKFLWNINDDANLLTVQTRVLVDGRRDRSIEQVLLKEDFKSHFDVIWDDIGRRIKLAYKIKDEKDGQ